MQRPEVDFLTHYPQIARIADAKLKTDVLELLQYFWQESKWENFEDVPTSPEIPYPNLPHTQCVLDLSLAIAETFERHHGTKVDYDHLIAAAVLQDASKLLELSPGQGGGGAEFTEMGSWFTHAFWCAHLCTLKGFPKEIINTILTHSPGSAQFPKSLEGKIIYYADQLDVIAIHKDRWRKNLYITK